MADKIIPPQLAEGISILKKGREFLTDHWCRGALGRNKYGSHIFPDRAETVCSLGALMRFTPNVRQTSSTDSARNYLQGTCAYNFLNKSAHETRYGNIVSVNDLGDYYATLEMWDKAIALAEQAAQECEDNQQENDHGKAA